MSEELTQWVRQIRSILDATADAMRVLGIASNAVGVSDAVHQGAASTAEDAIPKLVKLVRDANAQAERLHAADPTLGAIVHPLLGVPGEKPVVDLRPWWSRVLERVSSTARRNTAGEQLATLRLEADAALTRAAERRV